MSKKELKICAISDLHGDFPEIKEPCDILLIAGDISPLDIQNNMVKMKVWLETEFSFWIKSIPCDKVFLIGGNHDKFLEKISQANLYTFEKQLEGKLKYLMNEEYNYIDKNLNSWSIFGTPYCHIFGNWSFMHSDEFMTEKFKNIPDKVDIIISHDPPFNIGNVDVVLEQTRWSNHALEHLGNEPLRKRLEEIKFKFMCSGHIHSGEHDLVQFDEGMCVNVSIKNEQYKVTYPPFYYTLYK